MTVRLRMEIKKLHEFRDVFTDPLVETDFCYDSSGIYFHKWKQIPICMDTIENAEYAYGKFLSLTEISYLEVYGFFQSLYIQQDAIKHLYKIIMGTKLDIERNYPVLKIIREKRNCYVGHPTEKTSNGSKSYHGVSPHFREFTIDIYDWNESASNYESLDLEDMYNKQRSEIDKILEVMINKMKNIKKKKQEKIDVLDVDFSFEQHLFFKFFWKSDVEITKNRFKDLKDGYYKLIDKLKVFYGGSLDSLLGLDSVNKEIIYSLENFPGFNNEEIENRIYFDFLTKRMEEIKEIVEEIKLSAIKSK